MVYWPKLNGGFYEGKVTAIKCIDWHWIDHCIIAHH